MSIRRRGLAFSEEGPGEREQHCRHPGRYGQRDLQLVSASRDEFLCHNMKSHDRSKSSGERPQEKAGVAGAASAGSVNDLARMPKHPAQQRSRRSAVPIPDWIF